MTLIELCPTEIRFMHKQISSEFRCGRSVNETIVEILQGTMSIHELPTIKVVFINDTYYSFDNRRLYVYRVLHQYGKLDKVTVMLASKNQFQRSRFTTINNGSTVTLRNDETLPHSCATSVINRPRAEERSMSQLIQRLGFINLDRSQSSSKALGTSKNDSAAELEGQQQKAMDNATLFCAKNNLKSTIEEAEKLKFNADNKTDEFVTAQAACSSGRKEDDLNALRDAKKNFCLNSIASKNDLVTRESDEASSSNNKAKYSISNTVNNLAPDPQQTEVSKAKNESLVIDSDDDDEYWYHQEYFDALYGDDRDYLYDYCCFSDDDDQSLNY